MRLLVLIVIVLSASLPAAAQDDYGFRFVRVRYDDPRGSGMRWGGDAWAHDYPTAEQNFYTALERTTRIHLDGPPLVLTLDDDRIFDYPVLYLCEPGFWNVSDEEAAKLREYLARGGFILFDDFRGEREWARFYDQMKRVLPDREPVELPPDHPVWTVYFDIDPVEAPSNVSGGYFTRYDDRYLAFFDDAGRMMALSCFNQDIGDGWEYPDRNWENVSTINFQMGINFVIYALTH